MANTARRRETVTNGGDGKPPFRPRRTRTRYASFGRVFRSGGDSQFEKRLARLAVLYEDLRVEVLAATLDPGVLPDLEPFGANSPAGSRLRPSSTNTQGVRWHEVKPENGVGIQI